jgi:predicted short-subunit dehydrogenase-like oxidoreductase (DUF2520 family)
MGLFGSISIVGTGNVAFQLGKALIRSGSFIVDIYGRNHHEAEQLAKTLSCSIVNSLSELKGDLVILCVSDRSIQEVSKLIPSNKIVVHTSGAINLEVLEDHPLRGVLYPLQTLSKYKDVDFSSVPLLVESNDSNLLDKIEQLASAMSHRVVRIKSNERKQIHLAAVYVNNFVNHLIFLAKNRMEDHQLEWELILPLLDETISKIKEIGPFEAQTGPAKRNDLHTIEEHLNLQEGKEKEIYQLLTESIKQTYQP